MCGWPLRWRRIWSRRFLIVDEVLAVGDAEFQKKCLGKMGEMAHGERTVLFISHNMAAVETLCPRSIWLADGEVVRVGGTEELVTAYLGQGTSSREHVVKCTTELFIERKAVSCGGSNERFDECGLCFQS